MTAASGTSRTTMRPHRWLQSRAAARSPVHLGAITLRRASSLQELCAARCSCSTLGAAGRRRTVPRPPPSRRAASAMAVLGVRSKRPGQSEWCAPLKSARLLRCALPAHSSLSRFARSLPQSLARATHTKPPLIPRGPSLAVDARREGVRPIFHCLWKKMTQYNVTLYVLRD